VLRPGGRLAIADIVTEQQLTDAIISNADLWASCIGGGAQQDSDRHAIEAAGTRIEVIHRNGYGFISQQARNASAK
jgi:arsenite methyltransferase